MRPPRQLPAPRYGKGVSRPNTADFEDTMVTTKERIFEPKSEPVNPQASASVGPIDWAQQLRLDMRYSADNYLNVLSQMDMRSMKRKADIASRMNDLQGKHKAYASMMVLSALVPLKDGISMSAVAESVGMGVTMWMLSPNFRQQVKSFKRDARMAIEDMAEARRRAQSQNVRDKVEHYREKHGGELPMSLKYRLARIEAEDRNGRLPFNETSAALTYLGLSEAMFNQMRSSDVDPAVFQEHYDCLMERFWDDVQKDGLNQERVNSVSRIIMGQRMRYEPRWANMFVETAHGEVDMDMVDHVDPHTGEVRRVWVGTWSTRLNEPVTGGSFTARPPYNEMQHELSLSTAMAREMERAALNGNIKDLNETLLAYGSAWSVRDKAMDVQSVPGAIGEKIRRARRGLEAMEFDGFDRDQQRDIYATSFVRAMDLVAQAHPDIERHWAQQYGSQWRSEMRDFAATPEETYNRWQRGEFYSDARESPGHDNAHADPHTERMREDSKRRRSAYKRARNNQEYNDHKTSAFKSETDFELNDVDDGFEMGGDNRPPRNDGFEPSL